MTNALDCASQNREIPCHRPSDIVTNTSGSSSSTNGTGQFICRARYVIGVERYRYQTLCISKNNNNGRQGDECGCCRGDCPISCTEYCHVNEGQSGVYVYDWYSNFPQRYCVTKGRSLQLKQQNPVRWQCKAYSGWFLDESGSIYKEYQWSDETDGITSLRERLWTIQGAIQDFVAYLGF